MDEGSNQPRENDPFRGFQNDLMSRHTIVFFVYSIRITFNCKKVMTANEEDEIQLPLKADNGHVFRGVASVGVRINAFELNLEEAPDKVFQHELRFVAEYLSNSGQTEAKELARGPSNDQSKEIRRELHWALWRILFDENGDFFGADKNKFVYDCALLLYSKHQLMEEGKTRKFMITEQSLENLGECSRAYIRRCECVKAFLTATDEVEVRNERVVEPGGDRSVVHFLESLCTQRIHERNEHYAFGNRVFEKDSVVGLEGDPRICKEGMEKNVRFVGDNPHQSKAIVQLDAKKSAFFPADDLLQFVVVFLNSTLNQIEYDLSQPAKFHTIAKQLKGIALQTIHLPEVQMIFSASGLTDRGANKLMIPNQKINLIKYYDQKYNKQLRFPCLPCVIYRKGNQESFFPMEVLKIIGGQRVPLDKQSPRLTEQMIQNCQILPSNLPRAIETQRDKGMLQSANPFFRAHRIRIDTNMMEAEAQHLYPPALTFSGQNQIEPTSSGMLDIRLADHGQQLPLRYSLPCEFPKIWAVAIVQAAVRKDQCRQFCENLIRFAQKRGVQMGLPPRVDFIEDVSLECVHEMFEYYSKHCCRFVLFFASGKESAHAGDIHHLFKLQEIKHGVLTQHVSPKSVAKALTRKGVTVLENILLKMNLKLGGANYEISTAQFFKQANGIRQDIISEQWLGTKRMFFGLDMSHAPPQTLVERRTGKAPAIPTIVGMAYTISKNMLKLNGTYWMQQPRVTTVKATAPMVSTIKEALLTFHDNNGFFPEHIFVFRGGASEGEYKKVVQWEGGAFMDAFTELISARKMNKPPALTVIICQRHSNYRVIPGNVPPGGRPRDQNCQPGTVLDKKVVHPSLMEFILIGHWTIQGTAKPLRCTVVKDTASPRVTLTELEHISYALCYQHGICCSPTSVPGVLYSAGDLAKRGGNNWRTNMMDREIIQFDLPPLGQPEEVRAQTQEQLDKQRATHFAQVTEELRPNIPTKFWA